MTELIERDQQVFLQMQAKSPVGRDKIIDRIVHVHYDGLVRTFYLSTTALIYRIGSNS
jgi:hypothetical protein